ncbi:hypothetical protein K8B83_20695 [Shewanella inventionis]|uniref:Lipoprotein n=1 Tax=Shewanella inventionis TaxID=1738770 RepID=A0ABQ1IX64_9GAMM|nr:hypothetical protein [Shewanella inventionis]MCL1157020.1 hypothetical protein [Shewanella inventionis]UAL43182.1 hypothetical protein K8B83_20695 [Shewanella inventionis]GGB54613.1 hypothetical protein GCM10011607_13940 [Shewanella inventionis]
MKSSIFLITFMTLSGCSLEQSRQSEIQTIPNESQVVAASSEDALIVKAKGVKDHSQTIKRMSKNVQSKYTIQLNQQKFTTQSKVLKANQTVYNMDINRYGKVKGSIVVVTNDLPSELELTNDFKVYQIAVDTYRLLSQSGELDLYYWYKSFSDSSAFSVVELEIDYTPASNQLIY